MRRYNQANELYSASMTFSGMRWPRIAVVGFLLSVSAAAQQNLSTLLHTDVKGQYYAMKRVMQGFYDHSVLKSEVERNSEPYDLYICDTGNEYTGSADDSTGTTDAISTLAVQIVLWRNDLRKLGYPEAVWRPILVEYENAELDLYTRSKTVTQAVLDQSLKQYERSVAALGKALTAYRLQSNPALRPVTQEGGCGAGEQMVRVKVEPPNGRVFFIPVFFYELCRVQQINPNDVNQCDKWREAMDGQLTAVAGDYRYSARWPDGITREAMLTFDHQKMDPVVVIRKPQQ